MAVTLITSPRFLDHLTPPGHPERVERAEVMATVARRWAGARLKAPRRASQPELLRVHARAHVDTIAATAGRSVALDPDTYASPESSEVARLAAGACLVALEHTLAHGEAALALVRPPGHHAERDRTMGFCLFNNVAIAAAAALADGVDRVAIVDFDVHHGNGTQWIFYDDPRVLYLSVHQYPFYPGTGSAREAGRGKGTGFTVNLPVAVGATDGDYALLFDRVAAPILRAFAPAVLLVSAGFDAHASDPLGGMRVSTDGFGMMTRHLKRVAAEQAEGRMVLVTEGGYDLSALEEALETTIAVLEAGVDEPMSGSQSAAEAAGEIGRDALATALAVQRAHWPTL